MFASCDSKKFAPLSLAVWDQTRTPAPRAISLSQVNISSTPLHIFMYSGALCVQQYYPISVNAYPFGKGLDLLQLRERHGLDIRRVNASTYIHSLIRI